MADQAADSRNWFLRISSGTVFGPVSTQGLATWAAKGQVLAGNEISLDRKQWLLAETLAELDIAWYLEDGEGLLTGPFHRRVAEKLIATGHGGSRLVAAAEADLSRLRAPAMPRAGATPAGGHLELDLEGAPPAEAAAAESTPAAWVEERESLRLRIAELETQTQNLLRAAEKETRTQNRQLENARKQIATLQAELEELRQLAADPAAPAAEPAGGNETAALEEALENARREIGDLRQAAERESDTQQARITELEQQLAAAADAGSAVAALRAEKERLATDLAAEQAAQAALRARLDELQETAAETARLRDALGGQNEELEHLRAEKTQWQSARKDVETLKVRIADLVGQIAEHAATTESVGMLQARCTTLDESLRKAQAGYAELLAFSNSRDQEHQAALQAAETQLVALREQREAAAASAQSLTDQLAAAAQQEPARIRELAARLRDQETLLAGVLAESQQVTGQLLASERDSFTALRDGSVARQTLLQARLAALQKLKGGETGDVFEREAKLRTDRANSARTQDTLNTLQQEHARYVRQAEAREHELVNRIRLLELEEERLKERAAEAEPLFQRNQRLTEMLQDREQKLAQERQQRSIEQAQLEEAHQAIMAQIESRQQKEERLPLAPAEGGEPGTATPPGRESFRAPPWMRLRR